MNINTAVYQSSASYRLLNTTFAAIVNEAFIDALPFNRHDLSEENERTLSEYTMKVVESFGGFDSLAYAMNNEKDPAKKQYLTDIYNICMETANQAVSRISSRGKIANEDMVAPTLDKKEYAEFVNKADKLDLDRVAEIVKDKVIKTLNEEKEARVRNDEVNQALKEAIDEADKKVDHSNDDVEDDEEDADVPEDDTEDSDAKDDKEEKDDSSDETDDSDKDESEDEEEDEDDPSESDEDESDTEDKKKKGKSSKNEKDDDAAAESFMTLISGSVLKRPDTHRSFFNTLLNKAMEQIVVTENVAMMDSDEISKDRILDLTMESTLPNIFNYKPNSERALNFVMHYSKSQKLNRDERKIVTEAALVDATIAYTMMETLHTMNLIKPTVSDVRTATESYSRIDRKYDAMVDIVNAAVSESIRNARPRFSDTKFDKIDKLEAGIESLTRLSTALPDDGNFTKSKTNLDKAVEGMKADLDRLNSAPTPYKETYYDHLAMEGYKAQMNKIATMVGFCNNRANKIVIEHYAGSSIMDVKIYGYGNDPIMTTHIAMEGFNGSVNDMMLITLDTKLDSKNMPSVFYKEMDGSGKEVMIR